MAQKEDDYLIFTEVGKGEGFNRQESNIERLPIEDKYATLYEELVARCDPACFMEPYDKEKVNHANEIYSQVLQNENSPEVLKQLRSRAIKELNIKFGTLYLYKELKRICNPKNFTGENYNADYLTLANNLFSQVYEYADDVEKLEEIEKQANDLIELEKLREKKDEERKNKELKEKEEKKKKQLQIANIKTRIDDLYTYENSITVLIPICIIGLGILVTAISGSYFYSFYYFQDDAAIRTFFIGLAFVVILFTYLCFFIPRATKKIDMERKDLNSKLKELEQ